MKTNKWCSILLMGLMLGACSKDVIEPDNGEHTDWETNKVGYINLSVNLPSQVASRSEAFDDGDVSEWAVKDAILLLFVAGNSNETEADATFIGAYELALNMNVQTPAADALSSTA